MYCASCHTAVRVTFIYLFIYLFFFNGKSNDGSHVMALQPIIVLLEATYFVAGTLTIA